MDNPFERPDKPEDEFTEEDWHGVRFRNLLRMCMFVKEGMEPMREKDKEIFRSIAKDKKPGRQAK